jgi:hypothetical protein
LWQEIVMHAELICGPVCRRALLLGLAMLPASNLPQNFGSRQRATGVWALAADSRPQFLRPRLEIEPENAALSA